MVCDLKKCKQTLFSANKGEIRFSLFRPMTFRKNDWPCKTKKIHKEFLNIWFWISFFFQSLFIDVEKFSEKQNIRIKKESFLSLPLSVVVLCLNWLILFFLIQFKHICFLIFWSYSILSFLYLILCLKSFFLHPFSSTTKLELNRKRKQD